MGYGKQLTCLKKDIYFRILIILLSIFTKWLHFYLKSKPSFLKFHWFLNLTPAPITNMGRPYYLYDFPECLRNKLHHWQLISSIVQGFRRRWSIEYLPQFLARGKWTKLIRNKIVHYYSRRLCENSEYYNISYIVDKLKLCYVVLTFVIYFSWKWCI